MALAVGVALFGTAATSQAKPNNWVPIGQPNWNNRFPQQNPIRLGVVVHPANNGGLFVSQIFPNMPAQFMGLQRGDIIYQANGIWTRTLADLNRGLNLAEMNWGQVQLIVRSGRNGQLYQVVGQIYQPHGGAGPAAIRNLKRTAPPAGFRLPVR